MIYNLILNFINNNPSLIALLVGLFAFVIYTREKREHKRDVAKLILQEIRYAENNIKVARERGASFKLSIKLLPTSTWYNSIHLFVKDLRETEIDTISSFYSKVEYIDHVINAISTYKLNLKVQVGSPQAIAQINMPQMGSGQQSTNAPEPNQPPVMVVPTKLVAEKILKDVTSQVEYIYNTPVVDRLRSISEKKWYHVL